MTRSYFACVRSAEDLLRQRRELVADLEAFHSQRMDATAAHYQAYDDKRVKDLRSDIAQMVAAATMYGLGAILEQQLPQR
jgi:hypothetical protein